MKENKTFFRLFACCAMVKGARQTTICDIQRAEYHTITNDLAELLSMLENYSIDEVKATFNHRYDDIINNTITDLVNKEYGFFTSIPDQFKPIELNWDKPYYISNAILDFDDIIPYNLSTVLTNLENLGCQSIQFRIWGNLPIYSLTNILKQFDKSKFKSFEFYIKYQQDYDIVCMENLINDVFRTLCITLFSAPQVKQYVYRGVPINLITENLNAHSCGIISKNFFTLNIDFFTESQQHNTCLNRKISIDSYGNIKNCPSMKHHFGNINEVIFADVIKNEEFTKYWHINKNQISVCKDCEYRHICSDCRVFLEDPEDIYSKPLKCGYNPYTNIWEDWSTNPLKNAAKQHYFDNV